MAEDGVISSFDDVIGESGYSDRAMQIAREVDKIIPTLPAKNYIKTDNPIYIAIMPDDSASIAGVNPKKIDNTQDVIDGHNFIIKALMGSGEKDKILFKTRYLNGIVLNDWAHLEEAREMDKSNFHPSGDTPLYDNTIHLLNSVIYEKEMALERGQRHARWGIMIISDADDTASNAKAEDVKVMLDNMKEEGELLSTTAPDNRHAGSIAFFGISDGTTDFEEIANKMGIEWVTTADRKNPTEMRRKFNTYSPTLIRGLRVIPAPFR